MPKLPALFALYFAQGLPFGFQATALPLLLRERGVSLTNIGFASLLSAPWLFKAVWAPLVERYGSARFGQRKSWIVPMQACLVATALLGAHHQEPRTLALLVLAMNFFAATQDIAVDGLAVSWLRPEQLGMGNALQVVGYKLGMLTGGGLLVWASEKIGVSGLFYAIALGMALVMMLALAMRESDVSVLHATPTPFGALFRLLWQALRAPHTGATLAVVASYKMGETMADAMWKPLLLDRGFSAASIGLWAGTYGLLFSLFGSAIAGLFARHHIVRTLLLIACARAFSVSLEWWVSVHPAPSAALVIAVTCVEHLAGGALTTVLFALMMRSSERAIGGMHFTLLASVEVWGKLPLGALSGVVSERCGYGFLFGCASALCVAFILLVYLLQNRLAPKPAPVSNAVQRAQ